MFIFIAVVLSLSPVPGSPEVVMDDVSSRLVPGSGEILKESQCKDEKCRDEDPADLTGELNFLMCQ